ncbi:MAG: sensor histidine kinase [Blastocatellia bacterium]
MMEATEKYAPAVPTPDLLVNMPGASLTEEEMLSQDVVTIPGENFAGKSVYVGRGIEMPETAPSISPAVPLAGSIAGSVPGSIPGVVIAGETEEQRRIRQRLAELEEQYERLREQERARAGFISMVVHDIRSPLTVVMGALDLLNEDLQAGKPLNYTYYKHLFSESLNNCGEISRLIEDMLELSRMRERRLPLQFELTGCETIIEQATSMAAGVARQAGVQVNSQTHGEMPRVFVDRRQIHRALMNLINNAVKFTPRGGEVTVSARMLEERRRDAAYDYVLLGVTDTGEGMTAEETPYVFDPYFQAPNGRRKTGTGLGLTIVKRIAVAHGGNVSVRSAPGQGSTFTLMIPVRDSAPDEVMEVLE